MARSSITIERSVVERKFDDLEIRALNFEVENVQLRNLIPSL